MGVYRENSILNQSVLMTAQRMLVAARTAPKGKGRDTIEAIIVSGEEKDSLAQQMRNFGHETSTSFFIRDAHNVDLSIAVVIIGTVIESLGLNEICQYCGYSNCATKDEQSDVPCIFNVGDLHLALGSAATIAAQDFVDNRIMFSVGKAAIQLGLFQKNIQIAMGIPLSASSKNPFFDRAK
jgi:uncharacterized ferredoxin-like protein